MGNLHYVEGHGVITNRDKNYQYRLYADGTIVDQHKNNSIVGYLEGSVLDVVFAMRAPKERQQFLIEFLNKI